MDRFLNLLDHAGLLSWFLVGGNFIVAIAFYVVLATIVDMFRTRGINLSGKKDLKG